MSDGTEKGTLGQAARRWLGTPAVVMLAACVGAQASAQADDSLCACQALQAGCPSPDLGWALQGGAACSAKQTRKALAHQAAFVIHTLDRLSSTRTSEVPVCLTASAHGQRNASRLLDANQIHQLDPARSTHQVSAP